MYKFIFSLLVLSLISCAEREKRDPEKAHLHLKIGTGNLSQGKYPEALSELLKAKSFDSENAVIFNNLGIAYFVRKRYSEAESQFRQALKLQPRYTEARNNLGRTLIEMNLYKDAIHELRKAVSDLTYVNPEKSLSNLGIAYFRNKEYSEAQRYLSESLKIRASHCLSSNYFARTLFEKKKYTQASIAFDQAVNSCGAEEIDEPYYFGALTYFKLKKLEDAQARFEEVLAKFPNGAYSNQAQRMLKIIKKK